MAAEGVAVESIEAAAIANGRALGPLAMLDETGIALNLSQARQARADGLEPRFCRPLAEPTLARLVAAGPIRPARGRRLLRLAERWRARAVAGPSALSPLAAQQPEPEAIRLRLLAAEAREALRCLEEGVVRSADDADAASVLGLGFPKAEGGVLRWAENFGLRRVRRGSGSVGRDAWRPLFAVALAARARRARRRARPLSWKGSAT